MANIPALLKLAGMLKVTRDTLGNRPEDFDMGTWAFKVPDCKTLYCAGGMFAVMFPQYGLYLEPMFGSDSPNQMLCLKNSDLVAYDALAKVFGITDIESRYIFSGNTYQVMKSTDISINMVYERVIKIIKNYNTAN